MKYKLQIHGVAEFEEVAQAEECIKKLLGIGLKKFDLALRTVEQEASTLEWIYKSGQLIYVNGNKFKGRASIKNFEDQKIWVTFEPGMQDFRGNETVTHSEEFTANYTEEEAKEMFTKLA